MASYYTISRLKQYREDRNSAAPLFKFKERALVHFAVDPEEAYMTTKLEKEKTFFLPFNKGSAPGDINCGAGNPLHVSGYKTGYLFEDVLQKDSLIDITGSFVFIEVYLLHHKGNLLEKIPEIPRLFFCPSICELLFV